MAYEKHTWETGETITAEKLNHMEDGIADGVSGITVIAQFQREEDTDEFSLDSINYTFKEVMDAVTSGKSVSLIVKYRTRKGHDDTPYDYLSMETEAQPPYVFSGEREKFYNRASQGFDYKKYEFMLASSVTTFKVTKETIG